VSSPNKRMDEQALRAGEAADWFVRISADDLSEADLQEWLRWLGDPLNAAEFSRFCDVWNGMDQLQPAALALLQSRQFEPAASSPQSKPQQGRGRSVFPGILGRALLAAGLACIIAASLWYVLQPYGRPRDPKAYTTALVNQAAELPDGSALTLAPRTRIAVDFGGEVRSLALSDGEAYFKVRPNKHKPFVVRTADLMVTAVGTAFDVRSDPGRAVVTVQDGVVDVSGVGDIRSLGGRWRVTAGYQVVYDRDSRNVRLAKVDPARALGWREGRLQYFDEPLDTVIADVNRYSSQPIRIRAQGIGRLTFTGTVFVESIDDWLAGIESTFPVRASRGRDNSITIDWASTQADGSAPPGE